MLSWSTKATNRSARSSRLSVRWSASDRVSSAISSSSVPPIVDPGAERLDLHRRRDGVPVGLPGGVLERLRRR